MNFKIIPQMSFFILITIFCFVESNAQNQESETIHLENVILDLDSKFWQSYNSCDLDRFKTFLTEDLEFYHDKGGLTKTSDKLLEIVSTELCGNKNSIVRRESIEGSIQVFPMDNYGAIITGEHLFYITENDQKERLTGKAKFTHVWKEKDKEWKMSRVLSYDHQPISENNHKK